MSYIIVKYASLYPGPRYIDESVFWSYSASMCNIDKESYSSVEEAETDLAKLTAFNPSVDYGIVEVKQ